MSKDTIIALLAGLIVLGLAGYTIEKIFIQLKSLDRRIKKLESTGDARRHTHKTLNGIFDADSLSVETLIRLQEALAISMARLKQITKILGKVSEGPYSYNDTPHVRESDETAARHSLAEQLRRLADEMENGNQT